VQLKNRINNDIEVLYKSEGGNEKQTFAKLFKICKNIAEEKKLIWEKFMW